MIDKTEKFAFSTTVLLVFVIIAASLIIFILTPSPISPTKLLFGYITNIYPKGNTLYLDFDPAVWYQDTPTEFPASTTCVMDGKCRECSLPITKSCLTNGYYIKNVDNATTPYAIASFTKAGTLLINENWNKDDPDSKPYKTLPLNQFYETYRDTATPDAWIAQAPYDLTVINGLVIVINQHYIP